MLRRCPASCATLGRPLQEKASGFGAGVRRATRLNLCVGNAEYMEEEECGADWLSFLGCSMVQIFLDSSRRLLLRRRLRGGSDVS